MKTIAFILIVSAAIVGCSNKPNSSATETREIKALSVESVKGLCLEGAYRDGKHCDASGNSVDIFKVCRVIIFNSGSCDEATANPDLNKTCKAAITGTDTCGDIADANIKRACLAAAYGNPDYCNEIH